MKPLEIARRRIHNSRLAETTLTAPEEVVRRHGAMQAQEYAQAKWSIGQRAKDLRDEDVDRALAEGSIIRTHVLRPTWHFVARDDLRWLLALTAPRVQRHNGPRYRALGLDEQTLRRGEDAIAAALAGGHHLTRGAIADVLDQAGIDRSGQRLPYLLMYCELEGVICSGGLEGKQHTYALLDERAPGGGPSDRDDAPTELMRRYLTSHGPATMQDFRWWSSLTPADIKKALDMLGSEVESQTIGETTFWVTATDTSGTPSVRGAHLLHAYDELIVGYTRSRYFGDARAKAARDSRAEGVPTGVVLLNSRIAGHWRRTTAKEKVLVEVMTYANPSPSHSRAFRAAAAALGRFLEREVTIDVRPLSAT